MCAYLRVVWFTLENIMEHKSVATVGGKYTKLTKVLCYCGRKIHETYKGALLLWEENTQNLQWCSVTAGGKYTKHTKALCYCGRKIHETYKGALLLWEGNTQNFKN